MKKVIGPSQLAFIIACLGVALSPASAEQREQETLGDVETNWPGVRFQLVKFDRIVSDRFLAVIRIFATRQAPASGTLIGTQPVPPPDVSPEDRYSARYAPRAFSLSSSQMIHDQTGRKFPVLPPVASAGRNYMPGEILRTLLPGEAAILTIQFAVPPELLYTASGMPKQTASFLLPNAKAAIAKVPIPPAESVDGLAVQGRR